MDSRYFQGYPAGVMVDGPYIQANVTGKCFWVCGQGVCNSAFNPSQYISALQTQDLHTEMVTVSVLSIPPQTGETIFPRHCYRYAMLSRMSVECIRIISNSSFTQTMCSVFPSVLPSYVSNLPAASIPPRWVQLGHFDCSQKCGVS